MPLFNRKYESKPVPSRTGRCNIGCPAVAEDLDDFKSISLTLGNKELRFADGIWIYSIRKSDLDDVTRINRRLKAVEEENNMCNVKIDVLLDLLAEHATELNASRAAEKLKKSVY